MMVEFTLNGRRVIREVPPNLTLLDLLRHHLGVTSVKRGCEEGECGACAVLLDRAAVNSCMILACRVEGMEVTTIEGLAREPEMIALRESFMEGGAIQCGFCTPGMLTAAYALLRDNPAPNRSEVKTAIEGNICRCTGYVLPIKAILDAAERIKAE